VTNAELLALLGEARRELAAAGMARASNSTFERLRADSRVAILHRKIDTALADPGGSIEETEGERAWRHAWEQEREANKRLVALLCEALKAENDTFCHDCGFGGEPVWKRIKELLAEGDKE
jgi:hypothetical protein